MRELMNPVSPLSSRFGVDTHILGNPLEEWNIRIVESRGQVIGFAFFGPSIAPGSGSGSGSGLMVRRADRPGAPTIVTARRVRLEQSLARLGTVACSPPPVLQPNAGTLPLCLYKPFLYKPCLHIRGTTVVCCL